MANCHNLFKDFNGEGYLMVAQSKIEKLETSDENVREVIKDYFEKGRGSVRVRAKTEIEVMKGGRQAIIVNELPYQVNKAVLLENMAGLVRGAELDSLVP